VEKFQQLDKNTMFGVRRGPRQPAPETSRLAGAAHSRGKRSEYSGKEGGEEGRGSEAKNRRRFWPGAAGTKKTR